jgi:hypothetical protein
LQIVLPDGRCRILHVRLKVATMIPAQINVGASVPLVREWQGWQVLNITGRFNIKTKVKRGGQECPRRTTLSLTPFSTPFMIEFCFPENLLFR